MACPTCTATMHSIGHGLWHCPRCGTLKGGYADGSATVPALVERVRDLHAAMADEVGFARWDVEAWRRLGIPEAVNLPGARVVT